MPKIKTHSGAAKDSLKLRLGMSKEGSLIGVIYSLKKAQNGKGI